MIKLNCKGFMMAEVIIVSTVILSTLVGLYTIFNKMYIVYTERSYYYNVDCVYVGKSIYEYLVSSSQFVSILNSDNFNNNNNYNLITKENDSYKCNGLEDTICQGLGNTYKIKNAIIFPYNKDVLSSYSNNSSFDVRLKDYLDYLSTSLNFDDDFSYIIIVELENGDYQYLGNYRIR